MVLHNTRKPDQYKGPKSATSRRLVEWVLSYLFGEIPVALDFEDVGVRKLNDLEPQVVIAPPSLAQILLIMRDPSFYLPEAFMRGHWYVASGSLAELVVHLHNRRGAKPANSGLFGGIIRSFIHIRKQYIQPLLTREVRTHYNSDSKLFEIILGPSMVYSCAFFDDAHGSLERAQENKLETTFERLNVDASKQSRILDIGCGWGSFARYAIKRPNVYVDGISIAKSQIEYAQDQVRASAKDRSSSVDFITADYKEYKPGDSRLYDHVVSIGMLEHVGKTQYNDFFSSVSRFLKIDGTAVIHSIVRRNTGRMNPWLDKHIFPGGFVPRASEVLKGIEDSGLSVDATYFHSGLNYKETLKHWLRNLEKNKNKILQILSDNADEIAATQNRTLTRDTRAYLAECAFRKWEFYLAGIQVIFDPAGGNFDVCQFAVRKQDRTFWR